MHMGEAITHQVTPTEQTQPPFTLNNKIFNWNSPQDHKGEDHGTIILDTAMNSPYISVATTKQKEGFVESKYVLDLAEVAIPVHNARVFLNKQQDTINYITQQGFSSLDPYASSSEYRHMGKTTHRECLRECSMMNATVPSTTKQVHDALKVANLPGQKPYIWVESNITAIHTGNSWREVYKYMVSFDGKETTGVPNNFYQYSCDVPKSVGYSYEYWHPQNGYHIQKPLKLEVALSYTTASPNCRVVTPVLPNKAEFEDTYEDCVCERRKNTEAIFHDKVEAESLTMALAQLSGIAEISVEDWRVTTKKSTQFSELTQGEPLSAMTVVAPQVVPSIEKRFINAEELTRLTISNRTARSVPAAKVMKILMKKSLKAIGPKLMEKVWEKLSKDKNANGNIFRQTKTMFGNLSAFHKHMNMILDDWILQRNGPVTTLSSIRRDSMDQSWIDIMNGNSEQIAQKGFVAVRKALLTAQKVVRQVIPKIIKNFVINANDTVANRINFEKESVISHQFRGSFLEITVLIPTYTQNVSNTFLMAALPYAVRPDAHFLIREIPSQLAVEAEDSTTGMTPCLMGILSKKSALDCTPIEVRFQPYTKLMTVGHANIWLLSGMASTIISCPGSQIKHFDLPLELNVFIVHRACRMESMNGYSLKILPNATLASLPISDPVHLLAYTLSSTLIPDDNIRWILLVTVSAIVLALVVAMGICLAVVIKKKPYTINLEMKQDSPEPETGYFPPQDIVDDYLASHPDSYKTLRKPTKPASH